MVNQTIIPQLTEAQWVAQLLENIPQAWFGDDAKKPNGVLYAVLQAIASNLLVVNDDMIAGFDVNRLQTSTGIEIDTFAQQFFGNQLPRTPGESDPAYIARIQASLFVPKVTQSAIQQLLEKLTGYPVRMIQPWNPGSTGAFGGLQQVQDGDFWPPTDLYENSLSYFDADQVGAPSIYGDALPPFTGAIQLSLPSGGIGNSPIWGFDAGAAFGAYPADAAYTGVFWGGNEPPLTAQQIMNVIVNSIAEGITILLQIVPAVVIGVTGFGQLPVGSGLLTIPVNLQALVGFYAVFASWNQSYSLWLGSQTNNNFQLASQGPTPSNSILNYLAISISEQGVSVLAPTVGASSITVVGIPTANDMIAVFPNWATTCWVSAVTGGSYTISFSTPCPVGGQLSTLAYALGPNAQQIAVSGDATGVTATGNVGSSFVPLVIADWNTTCAISGSGATYTITFSTPCPAGGGTLRIITYPL